MKFNKIKSGLLIMALLTGCEYNKPKKPETVEQKSDYAIGAYVGQLWEQNLLQQKELGLEMDKNLIIKGFSDAINQKLLLDQEEINNALEEHNKKLQPLIEKHQQKSIEKQKKIEEDYLNKNKKNKEIQVLTSGLQYEILQKSDKEAHSPTIDDNITVHYTGKLIDGTVFDSSISRGETASFPLSEVIKGWQEGIQLMSIGDKYRFTIPSELAYGDRATGRIPAGSVLIFDVELIDINKK